jgi:two-component system OmpR family sensor kinase
MWQWKTYRCKARLSVVDTGPGMAASEAGRVFERFVRGPCTTGRAGTGLGLPIVKAIIEAHGGTVTLTGNVGGGAVFTLTLGPPLATRVEPADAVVR